MIRALAEVVRNLKSVTVIKNKFMDNNFHKFEDLIKEDKYSVFIFACPAYIPLSFGRHPWFVLNKKGLLSRWEIEHYENKKNGGHLYLNNRPPFQGVNIFLYIKEYFWKAELIGYIEGDENSTAHKLIQFIENSGSTYPYCSEYSVTGPNSNTYVQWVLNKFPEFKVELPWNFIGKDFKINEKFN